MSRYLISSVTFILSQFFKWNLLVIYSQESLLRVAITLLVHGVLDDDEVTHGVGVAVLTEDQIPI